MTIYAQLEQDAIRDRKYTNRAMGLLHVVAANPATDQYLVDRIKELDEDISAFRKVDHRLRSCCVAFDLNELRPG